MVRKGDKVWIKSNNNWYYEIATVLQVISNQKGKEEVLVESQSHRELLTDYFFESNEAKEEGYSDCCAMRHLSHPTILSNLHRRSVVSLPYTMIGSVLISVNPLKKIEDPVPCGSPSVTGVPHPYNIAETAFTQMQFGIQQEKRGALEGPINQTVVVSGESGAGKTESSKMVLSHLVKRSGGGGQLDKKLLGTNPILEAFGNASTLRNANSSRFGKMLKLHFDNTEIVGASIDTYLLERSRVTGFEDGERNYHIFYQMLSTLAKNKQLGLSPKTSYAYLSPGGAYDPSFKPTVRKEDEKHFGEVYAGLTEIGLSKQELDRLFGFLAGILHLGNAVFTDDDRPEGFVAALDESNSVSQGAVQQAATLLGFESVDSLSKLFTEKKIKGGEITVFNDAKAANEARDAVARTLYTRVFNYILARVNQSLDTNASADQPVIGVLDIFGFETFAHNDFEQLLINYTNESLQATFNEQIFHSEAELYKKEKLVLDSGDQKMSAPKGNEECMALLEGSGKTPGILGIIGQEGEVPKASDSKLNDRLHKTFNGKNKHFGKVHPKNVDRNFIVIHFAGAVTYTVGSFLKKNVDTMPKEVDDIVSSTKFTLLHDIWACTGSTAANKGKKAGKKSKKKSSIVSKFKGQIMELKNYLDSTRCSFIRCIKPNPKMKRDNGVEWVDRKYVSMQLKALSVIQTAAVLKNGFPTRITYAELTESYSAILPESALASWRGIGGGSVTAFVAGLFWAFGVPRSSYKLGLTRVFFKGGMIGELDNILGAASAWEKGQDDDVNGFTKDQVFARFRKFFAVRRWRVAYAKALAVSAFTRVMQRTKDRGYSATKIQNWYRGAREKHRVRQLRRAALIVQKYYRRNKAYKQFKKLMKARDLELQKQEQEARAALERAKKEKAEADARKEAARKEREAKEKEQAAAAARAEELQRKQKQLEKQEKSFEKFKKNREVLMAKRRKQLAHLEEMGASMALDQDDDEDEGNAEYEKFVQEKEEQQRELEEVTEEQRTIKEELLKAKEEEEEYEKEVENLNAVLQKNEELYAALYQRWKAASRRLQAKRAMQLQELEDHNAAMGLGLVYSTQDYLQLRKDEKLNTSSRKQASKLAKFRVFRKQRRSTVKSNFAFDEDDEEDEDLGYHYNNTTKAHTAKIFHADGDKLPVKQGRFRLFNRWKTRHFKLNMKELEISWFTKNGKKEDTSNIFIMNDDTSKFKTRVIANPAQYASYNRGNIIEIKGGCLKNEQSSTRAETKNRSLVISFHNHNNFTEWMDALAPFAPDHPGSRVPSTTIGRIASSVRSSLKRSSNGSNSEGKVSNSDSILDDLDIDDEQVEVSDEEVKKTQLRLKALEKSGKDVAEAERLVLNEVLEEDILQEEEDELYDAPVMMFCKSCRIPQSILPSDNGQCPDCGTAVTSRKGF